VRRGGARWRAGVFAECGVFAGAVALIREAREWLRSGNELGFGGLADPESWLEKISGIGVALEPGEFLDGASLLETSAWVARAIS